MYVQPRIVLAACSVVLGIGRRRVVAQPRDAPAHLVPRLVQFAQRCREHDLRVAPDIDRALVVGLADGVAVARQTVAAQDAQGFVAPGRGHLHDDAELLVEERTQRELAAPAADLRGPVLRVAEVGAAVADAVALGHEQVDIQAHTEVAGERHLAHRGPQATVAAVVVREHEAGFAQLVHGSDQSLQLRRVVEIGHAAAELVRDLREHRAGHAHAALAEVDEQQRRVARLQLRRRGRAHVVERGERGDDEADRRRHLLLFTARGVAPARAHREAVLADRDADAECGAELEADGSHRVVERGVVARPRLGAACGSGVVAARRHPVAAELDALERDGSRKQVRDRFTHRHAARCRRIDGSERRALADRHRLAGEARVVGERDGAIGYRDLPGSDHRIAARQAADGAVADADQESLAGHGGMAQHVERDLGQVDVGEVELGHVDRMPLNVAMHLRRLAEQHLERHVDHGCVVTLGRAKRLLPARAGILRLAQADSGADDQPSLLRRHADDRMRAALARAYRGEARQVGGRDGHHVALLALVAPDLLGRQPALFERHLAQVETRAATGTVDQLRKRVRDAAGADVVNGQDGVRFAHRHAVVDDLLRTALDLGVAALHRIEIELGCVGAGRHRARRAAAHADAHAGAAELDQQGAGRELDLVRLRGRDRAEAAGDHDRLVIAAALAADALLARASWHGLLIHTEVAEQIRPSELVVEGGAAERPVDHDLQRARDVFRLAVGLALPRLGQARQVQVRNAEAREPRLGPGAAAGRAFVADLAAGTGGSAGKRRNRRRMVVRLHLHQHVRQLAARSVGGSLGRARRQPALCHAAFHHRRVVAVGHHGVPGRRGVAGANHLEHRVFLRHAVDGEGRIEDLVPAVLAVGLREHHQLDIARVAAEAAEGVEQIGDLVGREREAEGGVGCVERSAAGTEHVDDRHRRRHALIEQGPGFVDAREHALGHAVVQQGCAGRTLFGRERLRAAEQRLLQAQRVGRDALDAVHGAAAVARDVGGFRGPRRDRAQARADDDGPGRIGRFGRVAVAQQFGEALAQRRRERCVAPDPVHEAGFDAGDARCDAFEARGQRFGAKAR